MFKRNKEQFIKNQIRIDNYTEMVEEMERSLIKARTELDELFNNSGISPELAKTIESAIFRLHRTERYLANYQSNIKQLKEENKKIVKNRIKNK